MEKFLFIKRSKIRSLNFLQKKLTEVICINIKIKIIIIIILKLK